jgi:hypothetical protein
VLCGHSAGRSPHRTGTCRCLAGSRGTGGHFHGSCCSGRVRADCGHGLAGRARRRRWRWQAVAQSGGAGRAAALTHSMPSSPLEQPGVAGSRAGGERCLISWSSGGAGTVRGRAGHETQARGCGVGHCSGQPWRARSEGAASERVADGTGTSSGRGFSSRGRDGVLGRRASTQAEGRDLDVSQGSGRDVFKGTPRSLQASSASSSADAGWLMGDHAAAAGS